MRLLRLIPCVFLLMLSASCGTTPSASSLPTPNLDKVEKLAKCPPIPPEFTEKVLAPVFGAADSWPDWAKKLGDWGLEQWGRNQKARSWRTAHPDC